LLQCFRTRVDGVVPFRMERVAADVESFHFGVGDLDALLIGPLIERTLDLEPGFGGRRGDQLDHCGAADERLALRSGWLAPSRVLRLTWREYSSSSTSSRPTVFGLTSWPQALSAHASFSRLLETHVSGRIGSPIVAGSTRRVRSPSSVLSVAVTVGRPPPARRTRPGSSAGPSRSFRPRMIRDRASPVIAATPATPHHPAARAALAANTRLPRSSRFEPSASHLSRIAWPSIIRPR